MISFPVRSVPFLSLLIYAFPSLSFIFLSYPFRFLFPLASNYFLAMFANGRSLKCAFVAQGGRKLAATAYLSLAPYLSLPFLGLPLLGSFPFSSIPFPSSAFTGFLACLLLCLPFLAFASLSRPSSSFTSFLAFASNPFLAMSLKDRLLEYAFAAQGGRKFGATGNLFRPRRTAAGRPSPAGVET